MSTRYRTPWGTTLITRSTFRFVLFRPVTDPRGHEIIKRSNSYDTVQRLARRGDIILDRETDQVKRFGEGGWEMVQ